MGFFQIRIMAVSLIYRLLFFSIITRCKSESTNLFNQNNGKHSTQLGDILKPPPPPLSKISPVPFHGGSRLQRQNLEEGYQYPPPLQQPPPVPPSQDFKFPAPFYKQYNFNFVPPPQPFTTTSSPNLFQKVSGWLFTSTQTNYGHPGYSNIAPAKKDCNPCNLVPWIPVIRYDLGNPGAKQILPTYGPPSPTAAFANFVQYHPQPFHSNQNLKSPSPGVPHAVYGPPAQNQISNQGIVSSTYGPPSPTHSVTIPTPAPISSTYSAEISSSYGIPSTSIRQPSSSYGIPSSSYTIPSSSYGIPSSSYGVPSSTYGQPGSTYGQPSLSYGVPSTTYGTPNSTFPTPSPTYYNRPVTTAYNSDIPTSSGFDIEPASDLQLPKVTQPSGFKNSYGEPISNTHVLDIPYSVSATAAESTKIKEEIVPHDSKQSSSNGSLALANPAPFTLNRGRNIHTLQPVALPNLSVSPLPPIFNARPFRPLLPHQLNTDFVQGLNYMQTNKDNVNIEQSVPIAEFTQSVDYPPLINSSPIIDIDTIKTANQSKSYRNIGNRYVVTGIRDISSQASEDHVSAMKSDQDTSFESTGIEFGNDLYDSGFPSDLKPNSKIPSNHKAGFADLRGIEDADVDKFRTENNLQNIDSPLLYLKPSAPHKDFENFVLAISTPSKEESYEIYDEESTTANPHLSTLVPSSWDESRTDYSDALKPLPVTQEDENKPKIVQIIVPYTTNKHGEQKVNFNNDGQSWFLNSNVENQGRKVPSNTENPFGNTSPEEFEAIKTTHEEPLPTVTEHYDSTRLNEQAILNDLYDVKEPPFDIIKLQHTIDDWTEQQFSNHYKLQQRNRPSNKYAKQIPDDYFTTIGPITNYVTAASNYNYDLYDHEGQSSDHHPITNERNNTFTKSRKENNAKDKTKDKINNENQEGKKPHIYTAASSFRSTTTTPAPWGKIQTSISPLTKEKIYVVTSKPWKDDTIIAKKSNDWRNIGTFDFKSSDNDVSASDTLLFKSPRFPNRPSFGFSVIGEGHEASNPDSSYAFSKSWHQSINELDSQGQNSTVVLGGPQQNTTTNTYSETTMVNMEEDTTAMTTTAGPRDH